MKSNPIRDVIMSYMQETGSSAVKMANELNIPLSSFEKIKNSKAMPRSDLFAKIIKQIKLSDQAIVKLVNNLSDYRDNEMDVSNVWGSK